MQQTIQLSDNQTLTFMPPDAHIRTKLFMDPGYGMKLYNEGKIKVIQKPFLGTWVFELEVKAEGHTFNIESDEVALLPEALLLVLEDSI